MTSIAKESIVTAKTLAKTIAFVVTLSSCATATSLYSDCDSRYRAFSEVAHCTRLALKADSRYSFHKGYQANANMASAALDYLEEKVAAGTMPESEARFRMQEILTAIRAQDMARFQAVTANNPAFQSSPTVRTTCNTIGGVARCVSK